MTAFGIDFGTTNSVLAQWHGGQTEVISLDTPPGEWATLGFDKVLPSVIGVVPGKGWAYGWAAKRPGVARLDAVKRLLTYDDKVAVGNEYIYVDEGAGALFTQIKTAARQTGVEFDRAVVTIPANSMGLARVRTKVCAGLAGIEVPLLINEPTAAAMAFGSGLGAGSVVLVVDVGGGTSDVTLLQSVENVYVELASAGIPRFGGIDIDNRIVEKLKAEGTGGTLTKIREQEFLLEVELAKLRLSDRDQVEVPVPGRGMRTLTRQEVAGWVGDLVAQLDVPVREVLGAMGMTTADVDHLVLVGGSCKMPAVRDHIVELVGREPTAGVDPMTAIAQGAAVVAAILNGETEGEFFPSLGFSLGTVTVDPDPGASYSVIIPRHEPLPAKNSGTYFPVHEEQDSINVQVVEGIEYMPLSHDRNLIMPVEDDWIVPIPADTYEGGQGFDLTYEYSLDGILRVTIVDNATGKVLDTRDLGGVVGRDPRLLVEMHGRIEEITTDVVTTDDVASPPIAPPAAAGLPDDVAIVLSRARDKVMPLINEDDAAGVQELVDALEAAVGTPGQDDAKAALETLLRKWSYLF